MLMPHHVDTIPLPNSCSILSPSPTRSDLSLLTLDHGGLVQKAVLKHLAQVQDWENEAVETESPPAKQQKRPDARLWHLLIPPATTPLSRAPAPYPQNLTPSPSPTQPHCFAQDSLRLWTPVAVPPMLPGTSVLSKADWEQTKDTMVHAWEEDTHKLYGAGLLMWHCFCDGKAVPETKRAPASQALLSAFVAHMASMYSGKTISSYLNGVWAWHLLHGIPWHLEKREMDTMLQAADKLTPSSSKKKKCCSYTPGFILAVQQQLDLDRPLNAAVFTCLTMCFYASARLGEFTVQTLNSFSPNTHIMMQNLSYDQDHNNFKVTILHLPWTKVAANEGEDIYWASQDGDTDLTAALLNHLWVNQPSEVSHLFVYKATNMRWPLMKSNSWREWDALHVQQASSHCKGMASGSGLPLNTSSEESPSTS